MSVGTPTILKRFDAAFQYVARRVQERDRMLSALKLAILCKEHLLVVGPPGIAKSMVMDRFLECLPGVRTFRTQCTKRMSEENLLGSLDMKMFRETGEYRYRTEDGIVPAQFAYLDEFLDAPDSVLRSILGVLNEREFRKGKQHETSPLMTAVCTTNFSSKSEALQAVQDRFLFRLHLRPLSGEDSILNMLRKVTSSDNTKPPKLSLNDIRTLQRRVTQVVVPDTIMELVTRVAHAGRAHSRAIDITDRRVVRSLKALQAHALLCGRTYVIPRDVTVLESVFQVDGDEEQAKTFANVFATVARMVNNDVFNQSFDNYFIVKDMVDEMSGQLDSAIKADDTKEVQMIRVKLEDLQHALDNDSGAKALGRDTERLAAEVKALLTLIKKP